MHGKLNVAPIIGLVARFRAVAHSLAVIAVPRIEHAVWVHAYGHDGHGDRLVDKERMAGRARNRVANEFRTARHRILGDLVGSLEFHSRGGRHGAIERTTDYSTILRHRYGNRKIAIEPCWRKQARLRGIGILLARIYGIRSHFGRAPDRTGRGYVGLAGTAHFPGTAQFFGAAGISGTG